MKFGSVCSGIEAASVAWHPLGWTTEFVSEIEPFPSAVLAHHYPNTPNYGDMTKFEDWPDATLDVLVGGTPCQSFSVAGLRKGLDDPRGNLMLTFGAIARRYRPTWLVWENVPGVLSSNGGRDFGTFLGMLGELGYGFSYRVLDAQYFGVAQRRRRVFVVGCLGNWRRAAAVLFERDSLSGNPPPSRKTREVAPAIRSRSTGGGGLGTDFDCDGGLIHADPIARFVTAGEAKRQDWETCNFVAFHPTQDPISSTDGTTHCIGTGNSHGGATVAVAFDTTQITSAANYSSPKPGDPCHPLSAGAHAPAIATKAQVRRLTPIECERLQGFPDDYTRIPWKVGYWSADKHAPEVRAAIAEQCPDGPRYKALGNSMAVPVMRWIGERIQEVAA